MKLKFIICIGGLLGILAAGCRSDEPANLPTSSENPVAKIVVGSADVQTIASYDGPEPLSKPGKIVIDDFIVPPDAVTPDYSAAERIHKRHEFLLGVVKGNQPKSAEEAVRASFGETLADELKKTSLSTKRYADSSTTDLPTNVLVIQGRFTTIDEGNRSKRIMIGFGRGASDVQAQVVVLLTTTGPPIVLSQFVVNSQSGKKPGAAAGMGAMGVNAATTATSVAAGSAGQTSATVEGDAARMAREVARQVEKVMVDQKWIVAQPGSN